MKVESPIRFPSVAVLSPLLKVTNPSKSTSPSAAVPRGVVALKSLSLRCGCPLPTTALSVVFRSVPLTSRSSTPVALFVTCPLPFPLSESVTSGSMFPAMPSSWVNFSTAPVREIVPFWIEKFPN